jgi:hypothetical protein
MHTQSGGMQKIAWRSYVNEERTVMDRNEQGHVCVGCDSHICSFARIIKKTVLYVVVGPVLHNKH